MSKKWVIKHSGMPILQTFNSSSLSLDLINRKVQELICDYNKISDQEFFYRGKINSDKKMAYESKGHEKLHKFYWATKVHLGDYQVSQLIKDIARLLFSQKKFC